ncbi:MAG: hypothetical protein ACPGSI_00390 [Pikeienuella sp.]
MRGKPVGGICEAMKVCILGNSHVAAYKSAEADIAASFPDVEASYFGVSWPHIDACVCSADGAFGLQRAAADAVGLNWRGTFKHVRTINGRAMVNAAEFDAVFIVGRDIRMREILQLLATTDIEGFADRGRATLMSHAAFAAFITDLAKQAFPDDFAHLGAATRCAATIMPYLSAACLADERARYDDIRALEAAPADLDAVMGVVDDVVSARCKELGITYLPQRRDTMLNGILTAPEYSSGSIGLANGGAAHDAKDYRHMNARYAHVAVEDFIAFAQAK